MYIPFRMRVKIGGNKTLACKLHCTHCARRPLSPFSKCSAELHGNFVDKTIYMYLEARRGSERLVNVLCVVR